MELIFLPIVTELYDDLLELAHSLTYYQRSISPTMWQFFEQLYHLFKGSGVNFVEGKLSEKTSTICQPATQVSLSCVQR
jgi:hypothetical protein